MIRSKPVLPAPWSVCAVAALVATCVALFSQLGRAQVNKAGAHRRYIVEFEPQVALQWAHLPGDAAGIGPGIRVSFPIFDDGPIKKLNNSLAVGGGANWAYFREPCGHYFFEGGPLTPEDPGFAAWAEDCSAHHFMAPAVVQWNLFLSRALSIFAEPGIALLYERRSGKAICDNGEPCEKTDDSVKVPFVAWGGARIALGNSLAFAIRIGTPYVSAGASMFF